MENKAIEGIGASLGPLTVRVRVARQGHGLIHTGQVGPGRPTTFSENDEFDCPAQNVELYLGRGWVKRADAGAASSMRTTCNRARVPNEAHDPEAAQRLLARAKMNEETGCLLWQGSKQNGGYGQITYKRRLQTTHRLSWIAHHGPVPDGHYVCHICDNPACIAVEHLFLGTPSQNYRDMRRKGRTRYNAKLAVSEVKAIKKRLASGETASRVARDYAVSADQIAAIKNGQAWREIAPDE